MLCVKHVQNAFPQKQCNASTQGNSTRQVRFSCKKCEKSYVHITGMKDHMKRVHSEEVNYHCKYCGKGFKVARVLKKHAMDLHEQKVTPIICNVCGKMLFTKNAQQVHPKSHIETEKVKCDICPKMFKPSGLVSHMKYHELIPITCDICNKQVKGQHALVKHRRTHVAQIKDHQCAVCKKRFISQWQLREHQVIHTTEKPYQLHWSRIHKLSVLTFCYFKTWPLVYGLCVFSSWL